MCPAKHKPEFVCSSLLVLFFLSTILTLISPDFFIWFLFPHTSHHHHSTTDNYISSTLNLHKNHHLHQTCLPTSTAASVEA